MSKLPLPGSPLLCALATTALCAFAALAPWPASAVVDCSNIRTPAVGVDRSLWGDLQPADTGQIPAARDSTNYFGQTRPDSSFPLFTDVDIQNGYVFTSYLSGFQIWDAHATPNDPALVSVRDGWRSGDFPAWFLDGENRELIFGISLPSGRDDLMALAGIAPAGFSIWNTSNKTSPVALYQDLAKESNAVHSETINNRAYAFATAGNGSITTIRGGMGVQVYDMTAAQQYTRCVDTTTATNCPGVWIGRVGQSRVVSSIDGLQTASGKHILAFSSGLLLKGLELWDVSNPASPLKLHTADRLLSTDYVGDVALWEQNGHQYLGLRVPTEGRIYDITSCVASGGSCTAIDSSLVWHQALANVPASNWFVTFSRSGNTPFLYFGVENFCYGGLHKEYLFNVTDPTHPVEIGTTKTALFPDEFNNPVSVDYWGWYDVGSPTGFSNVMPRRAKFNGAYLYRMAWSIFDVHQWVAASPTPPVASFSYSPASPAAIYPGDVVTFNDTSTGRVDTRQWTFSPDGTPGTSAAAQPTVTFAAPGSKSVSLTVSNTLFPNSPSTASNNVTVLDPSPVVTAAVVSPASPLVCQPVTFTANGVGGRPTLNVNWVVKDGNGATVASGAGTPFTWSTTGTTPAGGYTGTVTVSNTSGNASQSVPVTLGSLPALPAQGAFAPTNDTFTAGTVQFHVIASGATHWTWNFGDGSPVFDSSDPVAGPNPTHAYTVTGPYNVTVQVSNCQNQTGVASATLPVTITRVAPLTIDVFQAQGCAFGFCQFSPNQAITFAESFSGVPTSYDYDWDGNGTFEQSSTTPVTTHTYTAVGTYTPVIRANRGAESVTSTHPAIIISNVTIPPVISVSGPASGNTGQALSFSASASNCTGTVSDSGWTWSASGGTISGSGSAVQVTWATTGSKTVTATNSACGTASGSTSVSIGTVVNNSLTAAFSFTPTSPKTGDTVAFDGSASTGSPTGWQWNFGDGQTGSGTKTSHSYSQAGSYLVQLQVSKPGDGAGCSFGLCSATVTQTVTVLSSLQADFTSSASCIDEFGVNQCTTTAGTAVQLTANAPGATSLSWNFGDGTTATGSPVTHTWTTGTTAATYQVVLQASNGTTTVTVTRPFVVNPVVIPPPPPTKSVVLPWIAQTRGALVQSSDLYVHNPSTNPMNVTLEFRKRGLPETNPPKASKTIAPGATLYVPDVLDGLFNRQNVAGFISLTVDQGDMAPVITSYNTTVQADGKQFGQTISGIAMGGSTSAKDGSTTPAPQNLVGLINNSDRLAYFGVSNPTESPVNYQLRLFDKLGKLIGQTSQDLTVAPFGQRQFQSAEIESTFGVTNQDDYRVEVTATSTGANLLPYASNLRLSSQDPSFIEAGSSSNTRSYLLGALSTPGQNGTLWQSDLLLSNVNSQAVTADVTFTGIGVNAVPTAPLHVTLQPGETQRLQNVIASQWGINNAIGLLTITSTSPNGVFPIVQGESYDNSNPAKRFGQSMSALTDGNAAISGQGQYLAGLRQDAGHRTTLWLFNPGSSNGVYDLVYRNLDGSVIATTAGLQLAGGKLRQISPAQLPLPSSGAQNGFTIQIVVKSGQVLSAAQVVDNGTNDPSYIQGDVR